MRSANLQLRSALWMMLYPRSPSHGIPKRAWNRRITREMPFRVGSAVKTSAYLARYRYLVHRHCRLDHDSSLQ